MKKLKLDKEEKQILNDYEKGLFIKKLSLRLIQRHKKVAKNTLKKTENILKQDL